ncbi:hypothetical protein J4Q44_G00133750 [Coregonus suidteri]|uniref:Uncharacterized protein n=1 Tax=Coregonus suidteri TaxID=861788 RepID=A0AAN8M2P9_9TELE
MERVLQGCCMCRLRKTARNPDPQLTLLIDRPKTVFGLTRRVAFPQDLVCHNQEDHIPNNSKSCDVPRQWYPLLDRKSRAGERHPQPLSSLNTFRLKEEVLEEDCRNAATQQHLPVESVEVPQKRKLWNSHRVRI